MLVWTVCLVCRDFLGGCGICTVANGPVCRQVVIAPLLQPPKDRCYSDAPNTAGGIISLTLVLIDSIFEAEPRAHRLGSSYPARVQILFEFAHCTSLSKTSGWKI